MPKDTSIQSVLIIGSGPIVIGQACEFDYSGSQAARSLREEGIEVSLINSNPATIMTDSVTADHIYLKPLSPESIEEILQERKIDAVLPTMGGQTALNLTIEAGKMGLWEKYGVRLIGVDLDAIELTENREAFKKHIVEMGMGVAKSFIANSFLEGKDAAQKIGFPLVIRPSYTLGGSGGAFVFEEEDFDAALRRGLDISPIHEVLVEKALLGWKEFELELLRDHKDNVVVVCTIENVDPMGVHTGDSITVAPTMTASEKSCQEMREQAIAMIRSLGNFAGGCNVQFAQDPETEELIAVEINPRVSRSSALASKATGYPIAKIAAKLAIGYTLDELQSSESSDKSALYEPEMDYVIVKMPRWNFSKFPGADHTLGLQMKSVGEVMAIGKTFIEALQKACQSQENNRMGLGADKKEWIRTEDILDRLETPRDDRIYRIKDAVRLGVPLNTICKLTGINPWFIQEIQKLIPLEDKLMRYNVPSDIPDNFFIELKQHGYSDAQIAWLMRLEEKHISEERKRRGIRRVYKSIDTSSEFDAHSPYFFSTFAEANESKPSDKEKVIILGSGPNRIGQGIEFDYCCVHGILATRETGKESIMINCNPETVSTDFDIADKLYFEPVFWEHIDDILAHEKPEGVIVQLGGQTALKLAQKFHENNIPIIGTSYESMDLAEDRGRFSDLLKDLDIPYPDYGVANTAEEALKIANKVSYPVLIRPSYVLGGKSMRIVINDEELEKHVLSIYKHLPDNKVLVDQFLERAKEAEIDAICDGEDVLIMGIMEHIEPAGIHSGDSSAVLPSYSLSDEILTKMKEYTHKLAHALNIKGLINIQFAIDMHDKVHVIEANPRASRTVPFIAKAHNIPYLNIATKIMLGTHKLKDFDIQPKMEGWAIKIPVFSFDKFANVDKSLGPEMKSTGEKIHFIKSLNDPVFRDIERKRSLYLSR